MSTLAERVRTSRKALKLSQKAVAAEAGMIQQMISKLETGKAFYTRRFVQLADALKVNQAWLITGEGSPDPGAQEPISDFYVLANLLSEQQRDSFAAMMREILRISSDE